MRKKLFFLQMLILFVNELLIFRVQADILCNRGAINNHLHLFSLDVLQGKSRQRKCNSVIPVFLRNKRMHQHYIAFVKSIIDECKFSVYLRFKPASRRIVDD